MIVIPTLVALAFLWRNGNLPWLCWVVSGVGVFAWLCGKAMLNAKSDLNQGTTTNPRIFNFWMLTASLEMWVQWIVCLLAIILALVLKKA